MVSNNPSELRGSQIGEPRIMLRQPAPQWREPTPLDYLLFFVGIPAVLGVIFSLVGTRLTNGMPYIDSLLYMLLHMLTAWLPVCLGAYLIKYAFRTWRPPVLPVCMTGLLIALMPTAYLFQSLGDIYANLYPVFAMNRADQTIPSWNLEYLLHFLRFSMPVVPLFLAGVYGYRWMTGVDWFGYKPLTEEMPQTDGPSSDASELQRETATAGLLEGCKLPADAVVLAVKAEQHYIEIWTDQGKDLLRFRFRDAADILKDYNGAQVHRSWWVNLEKVRDYRQSGRKLHLIINDKLIVPVSLSYKNAILPLVKKQISKDSS